MCGICGIVSWDSTLDCVDRAGRINHMLDTLMHRGPDGSGIQHWPTGVMAMTRLAIRAHHDGKQPITDTESGVVMVCNGEIDNHQALRAWLKERGREVLQATDVAVIVPLYLELDEAFVTHLQGAFAIAIWDPRSSRLILARDRAGERSLFYSLREQEVSFASLLATLATPDAAHQKICPASIAGFLQQGYFSAPNSALQNIQKVLPGELVCFNYGKIQRKRYWQWAIVKASKSIAGLDAFDRIFRHAVQKQSDVDVNFGLFLSGGLDSSLITAVTKALHPDKKLTAYSLRFSEASYDEGLYAESVARRLAVDFVSVWLKPEDFPPTIKQLIWQVGEPLADPAWAPLALLAKRAAEDISVALVGEGADELFAGYPTYFGAGMAEYYARLPLKLRRFMCNWVESLPPSDRKVTFTFLLKHFVQGDDLNYLSRHLLWTSNISPQLLERLGVLPNPMAAKIYAGEEVLDRLQLHDLENALAEGLLTKADRGSMKSALELRAPFLDQAVMEFAGSLAKSQRIQGLQTKVFLKQYALRYLPKEIVYRKKRGLSVPLSGWLRGPLYAWAVEKLGGPWLEEVGINPKVALKLLEEHCLQRHNHARAIWTLAVLSEWLQWKLSR